MPAEAPPSPADDLLQSLVPEALDVRTRAYAPYSHFQVGAVLVGRSGRHYLGCNVENSSYGLCVCAERNCIVQAVAQGEREFEALVVATQSSPPSPPCGLCRQTLVEFCRDLPVLLVNPQGEQVRTSVAELLPLSFTSAYL
jgi:cytidine deaminase